MSKNHLHIFGLGYTATRLATRLQNEGWTITATSQSGRAGTRKWGDSKIIDDLHAATHVLSSIPPEGSGPLYDPVLRVYWDQLRALPCRWIGYFSTTGVYGDTGGEWVDETTSTLPTKKNWRQTNRTISDRNWLELGGISESPVHVLRLPGIYGPGGRSGLDRGTRGPGEPD
jgi:hypothetical protein